MAGHGTYAGVRGAGRRLPAALAQVASKRSGRLNRPRSRQSECGPGGSYGALKKALRAITLCCPNLKCGKVLGAQIDPIALRTDIVEMTADQVVKKLRGLPPT